MFLGSVRQPAILDPRFAGKGYDAGYITTAPGTRSIFYNTKTADPEVIKIDDKTKDVASLPEFVDAIGIGVFTPLSNRINAPVFIVDGANDHYMCSPVNCKDSRTLQASERPLFKNSPCLQAHVVPTAKHDLNTAAEVDGYFEAVRSWMDGHFGGRQTHAECS